MIEVETTVTLRDVVRNALGLYASDGAPWVGAIEDATVLAMQLGYTMAAATGGAYADHVVTREHAEIITDMMVNVDEDGVYIGDRGPIASLAAGEIAPE